MIQKILKAGQIISARKLREENSRLKRKDLKTVEARDAVPATSEQRIQGITRAALQTNSWVSAASFSKKLQKFLMLLLLMVSEMD